MAKALRVDLVTTAGGATGTVTFRITKGVSPLPGGASGLAETHSRQSLLAYIDDQFDNEELARFGLLFLIAHARKVDPTLGAGFKNAVESTVTLDLDAGTIVVSG